MSNSFYKYLSLQPDIKTKKIYALENIESNSLFFQKPTAFNDPFECKFSLVDISKNKIKNDVNKENLPEYNRKARREILKKNQSNTGQRRLKEDFAHRIEKYFFNRAGILCITPDSCNNLMWAYYADGHSGICVELDYGVISSELDADEHSLNEFDQIHYDDTFPQISYSDDTKYDVYRDVVFSKSSHWEHENEHRLLVIRRNDWTLKTRLISFKQPIFKSIILGTKFDLELLPMIKKYSGQIPLKKVIQNKNDYKLKVVNLYS